MYDLVVIGGGVAGLMAAGMAGATGARVLLLEKMEKPARKLRITGKGRCNLTNIRPIEEFLEKIPQGAEFVHYSLERFTNEDTVRFFESNGVPLTVERGGRVFPTSGRAWDVADALVAWVRKQGVEIRCNSQVENIIKISEGFGVKIGNEDVATLMVLITTGGVSYPATGSTGDGFQFAYDLGHTIVPLRPSLVPLAISDIRQYEGLSLKNVGLSLEIDSKIVMERFGDVDFTDRALGGATVLQVSRAAVDAIIDGRSVEILLDMKPALSETKLRNRISREIEAMPTANVKVLLQKLIPSQLIVKAAHDWGIKSSQLITKLTPEEINRLITVLKKLRFSILDYRPFTEAIVTAGGVSLDEVDPRSMESRIINGLYFAGELLDIDADTGGYNIQLALSTAVVAAESIVEKLKRQ